MPPIIVAIDGHSSCGKSTMAKALAQKVGYIYVDTGAMYRAVTLHALRNGWFAPDGTPAEDAIAAAMPGLQVDFTRDAQSGLPLVRLNGEVVEAQIRTMEVSNHVSPIAALPCVRTAMTRAQQAMGARGGIVMDGRDIGTAVFPEAQLKVFVTASEEVRAQRRYDELTAKGERVTLTEVLENVRQRDYIDSHRDVAPLRQAPDALVLDNSHLTREEQSAQLLAWFEERSR